MTGDITCLSCGAVGLFPCSRRYMSRHDEAWNALVVGACIGLGWKPKNLDDCDIVLSTDEAANPIPREIHVKAIKRLTKALGGET